MAQMPDTRVNVFGVEPTRDFIHRVMDLKDKMCERDKAMFDRTIDEWLRVHFVKKARRKGKASG